MLLPAPCFWFKRMAKHTNMLLCLSWPKNMHHGNKIPKGLCSPIIVLQVVGERLPEEFTEDRLVHLPGVLPAF